MGNRSSLENSKSNDARTSSLKESVGGILFEKVKAIQEDNPEKITGMLLEMPEKEIEIVLQDDSVLKERIDEAVKTLAFQGSNGNSLVMKRKQSLGDTIYPKVEAIYPEADTAEKITGMLLELEVEDLENLIQNEQGLLEQIHKAANVLVTTGIIEQSQSHTTKSLTPTRAELGEKLYETIVKWYPDEELAAKFTGMILEMNGDEIMKVVQEEELLKSKIIEAETALRNQK